MLSISLKNYPKIYLFDSVSIFYIYFATLMYTLKTNVNRHWFQPSSPTDINHLPHCIFTAHPRQGCLPLPTANLNNYPPHWSRAQIPPSLEHVLFIKYTQLHTLSIETAWSSVEQLGKGLTKNALTPEPEVKSSLFFHWNKHNWINYITYVTRLT